MSLFEEIKNEGNAAFSDLADTSGFPDVFKNSDDIFNAPFEDTPFPTKSPQQIANSYYDKPCVDIDGKLKVFADEATKEELCSVKELTEVIVPSNLKVKELQDITIWLYFGSDGAVLLQQHNEAKPDANDLMIFLENDDDTNYFGSVLRIKAGSSLLGRDDIPVKDILELAKDKQVNIKPRKVKKLIKEGVFKTQRGVFAWLIDTLSDTLGYLAGEVYELIGDFFFTTVPKFIDDYFRIDAKSWNPLNKKGEKRVDYDPLFISKSLLKSIENLQDDAKQKEQDNLIDEFTKPFFNRVKDLEKSVLKELNELDKSFPRRLLRKIKKSVRTVFDSVYALKTIFKDGTYNILGLIKSTLQAANALLCGIWNSLIDTIKGIFQLVGILFLGLREANKVKRNIGYYVALTVEYLENILESLTKIDFLELFKQLFLAPVAIAIKTYEFFSSVSGVTLIEFFYFIGYIVGLIVETAISILFTGGTLTLNRVLAKTFVEPFKALGKVFSKVIKGAASLFEKALKGISYLLKKLANPKQLIADLLTFLNKVLGLGKKYGDYVKEFLRPLLIELKVAKATIDLIADLGIIIVKNTNNLGKELALITPQRYTIRYNNIDILEGTEDTIKAFSKKIDEIRSSGGNGKDKAKKYLDDLSKGKKGVPKLSKKAIQEIEEKLAGALKIDEEIRPGAVAVLEGSLVNKKGKRVAILITDYSAAGLSKTERFSKYHPLVLKWLERSKLSTARLNGRGTAGKCAENFTISKWLYEAEKVLGIKQGKITLDKAKEILSGTVSKAHAIEKDKLSNIAHGMHKNACTHCNPMLKHFKITEIFD